MNSRKTIVLVLRTSKDFTFLDVELIVRHINGKWKSAIRPCIICLWDKATEHYDLGNIEFIPITNNLPGTWARIQLYSPEMEQYRPFLYVDLDTAIIQSLENIFDLVNNEYQFITLEDFYLKNHLATGLVWFPAKSDKLLNIWNSFTGITGRRMDAFLWGIIKADGFWQDLTDTIIDFKPVNGKLLTSVPEGANLVCFHGKPRIHNAQDIGWVKEYVNKTFAKRLQRRYKVTVIIPYNKDRGWLQDAVNSVPKNVQLILSEGDGNWPQNFNKAISQATGDYIKYLHEDDMLTPNCIEDSIKAMEEQGVDFIHGDAIELHQSSGKKIIFKSQKKVVSLKDLLNKNTIHSATLMYRKEVFEKIGGFDETLGKGVSEEYEFNLRCLKAGMKIGYCDSALAFYRRHSNQKIRTTPLDIIQEERSRVKNMYV